MNKPVGALTWRNSNSHTKTYGCKKLDTVIKRLSMKETSENCLDSEMIARKHANAISESSVVTKPDPSRCNNNISECEFDVENNDSKDEFVPSDENMDCSLQGESRLNEQPCCGKRTSLDSSNGGKGTVNGMECQPLARINGENESYAISIEHNLTTVGGDGENSDERSQCRQHELNPSKEINRSDVITSCDLTSNSRMKFDKESEPNAIRDCPRNRLSSCSASQSTCSEGSYSRRKHHKHHKHKQKHKSPVRSEDGSSVSPKVNPIFVWVRQENTRIVEVLCEDYDHRNRIRLTRTHLGWRAIPKTKRFAEAIIPRAKPSEEDKLSADQIKPKPVKKAKKKKAKKKKKAMKQGLDNPNLIKECSVALSRDELENYRSKFSDFTLPSDKNEDVWRSDSSPEEPSKSDCDLVRSPSLNVSNEIFKRSNKLIKSNSCDFPSLKKVLESLPRSISLDINSKTDNNPFKVQNEVHGIVGSAKFMLTSEELGLSVKSEPDLEKKDIEESLDNNEEAFSGLDSEESLHAKNHSVLDMTKHTSEFNDTDCDELGQLLKDIPDLEFVEEEEVDELDDEWSIPTDLTLPKPTTENKPCGIKLPPSITPVVTVTPVKPSEPLMAPLPEVTITPIPNPNPAHQQKSQNNFLETLLSSSRSVKSESESRNFNNQKSARRPLNCFQGERKTSKHFCDPDSESETLSKKLKTEDITLKSLLSKHQSGRPIKAVDSEAFVRSLKKMDGDESPKSRLQELLTDGVSSDPISQLKEVLSNPHLAVPDPLLVPRARLPALVASPASEIPRLLTMHFEKTIEETPFPPVTDSDMLEVSLSNLQSLLSCSPEKLKSSNTQDLVNYQKSLETFLEWQRYQTEIMKAQMKNSKSLSPGLSGDVSDMTAATAFSQMFWLPYINQLDFNCNNNRDFMTFMNSMQSQDYQANSTNLTAPPQINISQIPQPSPFLTPTSPMELESHLKTLAMWQEAVIMQQNTQSSRACTQVSSVSTLQDGQRRNVKVSSVPHPSNMKKQSPHGYGLQMMRGASTSPRREPLQNNHLGFEIYQDRTSSEYMKKPNRQNSFQPSLEDHCKQLELQQKYKQEQQNQFRKMHRSYTNYQADMYRQFKVNEKKKPGPVPGSISVKPLSNLIDRNNHFTENKNVWGQYEEDFKKKIEFTNSKCHQIYNQRFKMNEEKQSDWQNSKSKPEVKGSATETPKLKVKNLVDPNMSPPKLLKQIAPEHLPIVMEEQGQMSDESQAHLWHPLFGSNQIKQHPYNSPWRWTTVTVNGE